MAEGLLGGLLGGEDEAGGAEEAAESRPVADAFAAALASDHAKYDPAVAAAAAEFLRDQSRLLKAETDELEEQRPLRLHHLRDQSREGRLRRAGQRLRIAMQVFTALLATAIAVGVAMLVWSSAKDRSLIVEPFRTPPELAQRGYDGQVVAGRLLDQLSDLQNSYASKGVSLRTISTYSAEPTREVKLEIPETGVSIDELRRLLSDWLGHQTHISGSIVRNGANFSITARVDGEAKTFTGPDTDLDHLIQQAAEQVFATTQPFAYAEYLRSQNRLDDAVAIYQHLAAVGSKQDRAWAFVGWGETISGSDPQGAIRRYREAGELNPHLWLVWEDIARTQQFVLIDDEAALPNWRKAVASTDFGGAQPARARFYRIQDQVYVDERLGDYSDALAKIRPEAEQQTDPLIAYTAAGYTAWEAAYDHDNALANLWGQINIDRGEGVEDLRRRQVRQLRLKAWELGNIDDWNGAADAFDQSNRDPNVVGAKAGDATRYQLKAALQTKNAYWLSLEQIALARAGRVAEAQAIGASLPADCYTCRIAAAVTADAAGDSVGAGRLFGEAIRAGPSLPLAASQAGRARLERGDNDGAIALFAIAHSKGPHFADALEMWGEALMAKGDFSGAVEKFREADRFAPNWGRNHLRWGLALARLGRQDDAKRQFSAASGLDLSASDRSMFERAAGIPIR